MKGKKLGTGYITAASDAVLCDASRVQIRVRGEGENV